MGKAFKYERVAERISRDILSRLAVGERLPGTPELCERYEASEITLRRALQLLVQQDLVKRLPKTGTVLVRRPDAAAGRPRARRRTITVLAIRNWRFSAAIRCLAERFVAAHPEVGFDFAWRQRRDLASDLAEGDYDLVLANEWAARETVTTPTLRERFLPVRELPGLRFNEDDHFEQVVRWCRDDDGRLTCLPVSFSPVVDLINSAYPGAPQDALMEPCGIEAFADSLRRLRLPARAANSYPFLLHLGENRWPILVRMFGGELFSEDGSRCLLDRPEAVEAMEFLADLSHVRRTCCVPVAGDERIGEAGALFGSGHFLCTWGTHALTHSRYPFPTRFGPLPYGRRHVTHLRMDTILVSRNASPRRLVADFLNSLQTPESQWLLSERSDAITCNKAVCERFVKRMEGKYRGYDWLVKSLDFAEPNVRAPRRHAVLRLERGLYPLWLGIEPADRVCRAVAASVNRALAGEAEEAALVGSEKS